MRVLIAGGGVAGTALALALARGGAEPVVHEADPHADGDAGAFLTLASNGMRALAALDAAAAVERVGYPLETLRVLDASGAEVVRRPLGEDDPRLRFRCLRRADLAAALRAEAVRRGIEVRHGRRLTGATSGRGGVTATFAGGPDERGDLLVGADGLSSTVRRLVDPSGPPPRYAGQRVHYGYATGGPVARDDPATMTMIRASGAAFGYAVSPAGETSWFARVSGPPFERPGPGVDATRDALVTLLGQDTSPAAGIVAATGEQLLGTDARDLVPGRPWRRERLLVIGDAAHAASPATGQGAALALEDAVALSAALDAEPSVAAALAAYEADRRPVTEENIAASARLTTPPG